MTSVIEQAKAEVKKHINEYRSELLYEYLTIGGVRWDIDVVARQNILGTLVIAFLYFNKMLPPNFTWRDYDNVEHAMNYTGLMNLALSILAYSNAVYKVSWDHKAAVSELSNIEDIQNYNYFSGWPVR